MGGDAGRRGVLDGSAGVELLIVSFQIDSPGIQRRITSGLQSVHGGNWGRRQGRTATDHPSACAGCHRQSQDQ